MRCWPVYAPCSCATKTGISVCGVQWPGAPGLQVAKEEEEEGKIISIVVIGIIYKYFPSGTTKQEGTIMGHNAMKAM